MKVQLPWAGVYSAVVAVAVSALVSVPAPLRAQQPGGAVEEPKLEKLTFDEAKKQLLRKPGQTKFLDLQYAPEFAGRARSASAQAESAAAAPGGGTDQRAILESDVFAIDPATKNLYLLTDDRGLIVLNANDEITGRVAASGNRPDMMYIFSDKKQLLVLEQDWEKAYEQEQGGDTSQARTQLVQYDISDAKRPKVSKVVPLEGTVVDSRVVGKVLYITSSVYPQENYYRWGFYPSQQQAKEPKGRVYSINIEKLEVTAQADSQLPSGMRNMISIVEQPTSNGKFQYFALAVSPQDVQETGWWWRRASQVEVFDITDPNGAIKPVFRTSLQGNIQKATQVTLTDGYLVAVSNYPKDAKNPWNTPWRLIAESFKLPSSGDTVIKKVEAEYRLDKIKTAAEGLTGEDLTAKVEALYADKAMGLKNVFVKADDGVLTKYVADSSESSGDTTGLSANLRDVRFGKGKTGLEVYAFWVPQNNIDPFDLFRFNPADGKVSYVTRLQYEGWAERSIPFLHNGKKLILSLGYIIKPNDPEMKRYPQALLFEVSGNGKKTKLDKLDDLTLSNSGIWADLQGEDKNITFSFDSATGKGAVLFPVSGYSKKQGYFTGGKIVGFDLANLESEDDSVFKDGALILGESGWMKRVFEDSRSQVLRTFSDSEIAAFPSFADALKTTDEKLDAIRRIELARDMIAFLPVADGQGLQVVRRGGYSDKASTQLRLVKRTDADSDVTKVTAKLDVTGNYAGHYALKNDKFLLFSSRSYNKPAKDPKANPWGEWTQEYGVHVVSIEANALKLENKSVWETQEWGGFFNAYGSDAATQLPTVVEFGNGLLWNSGNTVFQVDTSDLAKISAKKFEVEGVPTAKDGVHGVNILNLGNELGLFYALNVQVETAKEEQRWNQLSVTRNFLARIELKQDGTSAKVKGAALNIPGNPIGLMSSGHLVTRDNAVMDIITENNGSTYRANQAPYLQSLTLANEATLTDSLRSNDLAANGFRRLDDALIALKAEQSSQGPIWRGVMAFDAMPGRWSPQTVNKASLEVVTVGANGHFNVEARLLPRYALTGYGQIMAVLAKPGVAGEYVVAIGSGSRVQAYELNSKTLDITPKGMHSYNEYNERSQDNSLVVKIPGTGRWYYWGWYGSSNPSVTLDPDGGRLYVSMGMSGVFTLDVVDAPKETVEEDKDAEDTVDVPSPFEVESTPLP